MQRSSPTNDPGPTSRTPEKIPPAPRTGDPDPDATRPEALAAVCDEIRGATRVLLTSHARPDGDSDGLPAGAGLCARPTGQVRRHRQCGSAARPVPRVPGGGPHPGGVRCRGHFDLLVVLECSDLSRPGVRGLDRYRVVNIDHHAGNAPYGVVNWFDPDAAACAELVVEVDRRPWRPFHP